MSWTPILQLTDERFLEVLNEVATVVHCLYPDKFRVRSDNRQGMYPHPVAVTVGSYGNLIFADYQPMKETTKIYMAKLHSPVQISLLKELGDIRSLAYSNGLLYACDKSKSEIHVVEINKKLALQPKSLRKGELQEELHARGLNADGSVKQLKERLVGH